MLTKTAQRDDERPNMHADDTFKFCSVESSEKSPAVAGERHDVVRCPPQ